MVVFAVVAASCSGSSSSANPASAPGSEPTSSPSIVITESTPATPPTVEATTIAPTTAAPATVPSGWTPVEPGTEVYNDPPCCTSNWAGVPSPTLPSPGAPLADGEYAVDSSFAWGTDVTKTAQDNSSPIYSVFSQGVRPVRTARRRGLPQQRAWNRYRHQLPPHCRA